MNIWTVLTFFITYKMAAALLPNNPWVDNSLCLPTDLPATCNLKKTACAPVNTILSSPAGGLVASITSCANVTGVVLDVGFFFKVGMSYGRGNPETLLDKISTDSNTSLSLRTCVVNSTGMLDYNKKLNRTAILVKLASQPLGPEVLMPLANAVTSCPEPVDLMLKDFMTCIRKACMDNVSVVSPIGGTAPVGTPQFPTGILPPQAVAQPQYSAVAQTPLLPQPLVAPQSPSLVQTPSLPQPLDAPQSSAITEATVLTQSSVGAQPTAMSQLQVAPQSPQAPQPLATPQTQPLAVNGAQITSPDVAQYLQSIMSSAT